MTSSAVTWPMGNSPAFSSSAVVMSWAVRPAAARAAWSGTTETNSSVPPITWAPRTPSTFCRRGTSTSSARRRSSLRSASPERARKTTGKSETEPANDVVSASSGSCAWRLEITRSTWDRARVRSVPYSNSSVTLLNEDAEVERDDSSPSTACRAVSRGSPTWASTTSGLAPG